MKLWNEMTQDELDAYNSIDGTRTNCVICERRMSFSAPEWREHHHDICGRSCWRKLLQLQREAIGVFG